MKKRMKIREELIKELIKKLIKKFIKKLIKKRVTGVMTIEMAYLMPIILLVFQMTVYSAFYYHDKMILLGAAGETAVVGAQYERKEDVRGEVNLESFFAEQIQGKLILFPGAESEICRTERMMEVSVFARKGRLEIHVIQRAAFSETEKFLRRKCALEEVLSEEKKEEE